MITVAGYRIHKLNTVHNCPWYCYKLIDNEDYYLGNDGMLYNPSHSQIARTWFEDKEAVITALELHLSHMERNVNTILGNDRTNFVPF